MSGPLAVWQRFSRWGESRRGRLVLAAVLAVVGFAATLPLVMVSIDFVKARDAVEEVLRRANREERTPEAVELLERGTVTVDGEPVGGPFVLAVAAQVFGPDGIIVNPRELASFMVSPTLPEWAPRPIVSAPGTTITIACGAVVAGLVAGLAGVGPAVLGTILVTALGASIAWHRGLITWVVAVAGAGGTLVLFLVAARVLLLALGAAGPLCAVAQGVVREAIRLRVMAFFMGATLVLIPLIMAWISPDQPLRYQVQTFLSRSTGLLYALSAVMILFLGCATVAFEQRDRQIWQTLTKPVTRLRYLIGKWLGLVSLAAVILLVGSASVFACLAYLETRPTQDFADAAAVTEEVLVGRQGTYPAYPPLSRDELVEAIDRSIDTDPILKEDIERGVRSEMDVRRTLAQQLQTAHLASLRTLAPGQSREYTFSGLRAARDAGRVITLRYKLHGGAEDSHETLPLLLRFPKTGQWVDRLFQAGQAYHFAVSPEVIEDDGTLVVELANVAYDGTQFQVPRLSVNFDQDGLEVLYPDIGFGENFLRAMLVDLSKLSFLAMLAVAAASVLSFPIACLLAFSVFLAASLGSFLGISINYYGATADAPTVVQWLQHAVKGIATATHWLLSPFGTVDATESLVRGRAIDAPALAHVVLVIGIVWWAIAAGLGWVLFNLKEIAIYSGEG